MSIDPWMGLVAIVIVLAAVVIDRTRAYRHLPAMLNRGRRRRR